MNKNLSIRHPFPRPNFGLDRGRITLKALIN